MAAGPTSLGLVYVGLNAFSGKPLWMQKIGEPRSRPFWIICGPTPSFSQ